MVAWILTAIVPDQEPQQNQVQAYNAIASVMNYRWQWLASDIPFDACSIYRALGKPEDFPAGFKESALERLDPVGESCLADEQEMSRRNRYPFVRVDSIQIGPDTARVYLRVIRDHYEHDETYTLANPRRLTWGISTVLISNALRVHRTRP